MRLHVTRLETLAKLAWAARMRKGSDTVEVLCGPRIETDESSFVEGAWNGPFGERDFDTASALFGSGGKVVNSHVLFASPTHTLERLFLIEEDAVLCVSNSLSFVLALAGRELDRGYVFLQADYDSITLGLTKSVKALPLKGGAASGGPAARTSESTRT